MPAEPPVGTVAIASDDPPITVVAKLGPERPDVTDGYGGWTEVARPRRTAVTTWEGQPARKMDLSILLDNHYAGTSIEATIRDLESLALPRAGGEPPTVTLAAKGGHVPYTGLTWVIEGLAWGDALMNAYGNRTRQAATLTLLEYVSDDLIDARTRKSPAQRRRDAAKKKKAGQGKKKGAKEKRKPSARNRRATGSRGRAATASPAFEGEDLMAIAARELGDVRRWREIADLNGIRDPRAVTVGQVLRLP